MVYKRGGSTNYCYNFRWRHTNADGTVEFFRIRQSARTANKKHAVEV